MRDAGIRQWSICSIRGNSSLNTGLSATHLIPSIQPVVYLHPADKDLSETTLVSANCLMPRVEIGGMALYPAARGIQIGNLRHLVSARRG